MSDSGILYKKLVCVRGEMNLMGALVAITIMCVTAFVTAQITRHGAVGQRVLAGKAERVGDSAAMRMILGKPELCKKAFWDAEKKDDGKTPDPKIAYFNPDGPVDSDAAKNLDKQLYTIKLGDIPWMIESQETESGKTHLYFSEIDKVARKTEASTITYAAVLNVEWERPTPTSESGGTTRAAIPGKSKLAFPMFLKTDVSTNQILECGESLDGDSDQNSKASARFGHLKGTSQVEHEISLTSTSSIVTITGTVSALCVRSNPDTAGIYGKLWWDGELCNFGNSWSTWVSNAGFAVNVHCTKIIHGKIGDKYKIQLYNEPYGTGYGCIQSQVTTLDYTIVDMPGMKIRDETPERRK